MLYEDNRDTVYFDRIAYPLVRYLGGKVFDCQTDSYL